MTLLDTFILIAGLCLMVGVALFANSKTATNTESYFLGGRKLPWWLAGLSMVATTFAVDTPIAVAEFVGKYGISGNWLWWSFLAGGIATAVFFAQYWRKAYVLTEVELIQLRYSGKAALALRKFKALYLGLAINVIIIGWVNFAMVQVFEGILDLPATIGHLFPDGTSASTMAWTLTFLLMIGTAIYSSISGFTGVVYADAIQFIIAMGGCILLAVLVIQSPEIGGLDALAAHIKATNPAALDFFPTLSAHSISGLTLTMTAGAFAVRLGMQWWACWYPGAEPGGGGYVAQRMMSAKNTRHAYLATFFFQFAHYCLRPWPWILVGLCAVVLYPELGFDEKGKGFVYVMRDFLPNGLKGLMVLAFFAAYMSTISTQLNWGASYIVNDFLPKSKSQTKSVRDGKLVTIVLMIIGGIVSLQIKSLESIWNFLLEAGAGLGFILILRWFYYRVNVQAEWAATLAPLIGYCISKYWFEFDFAAGLSFTVLFTIVVTFIVMFAFPSETDETLLKFVKRIQPHGAWGKFQSHAGNNSELPYRILLWLMAITCLYAILFGVGSALLIGASDTILYASIAVVSAGIGIWAYRKGGYEMTDDSNETELYAE